jgi:hypothetical protein
MNIPNIAFSDVAMERIYSSARRRTARARDGESTDRIVGKTVEAEVSGIMGEVAVRRLFGLDCDFPLEARADKGRPDFRLPKTGRSVEVKSSYNRRLYGLHLIVPVYTDPCDYDIWIFAPRPSENSIRFAGYWPGKANWITKDFQRGCGPQLAMPEGNLNPLHELVREEGL